MLPVLSPVRDPIPIQTSDPRPEASRPGMSFGMGRPVRVTVAPDDRVGREDGAGRVLIQVAVSPLAPAGVRPLLRRSVGE